MRNRTPLALLEQVLMLLVFALAAVWCLRAFVWADLRSQQTAHRDQALLAAQNGAETAKHFHGDLAAAARSLGGQWDGAVWTIGYDENWNETKQTPAMTLRVRLEDSPMEGLGQGSVTVHRGEDCLARLTVRWQEVSEDGETDP